MEIALITGASGGIGQAIARRLASDGYSLYLHYHSGEQKISELIDELKNNYPKQIFEALQADLTTPSGVKKLIEEVRDPIDCIVYNSGKSHVSLITEVSPHELIEHIQLHLTSPFQLVQALLPEMIQRKNGKIIFISSIWGLTGASMEVLYSMVKGGQNSLVKSLAKEVAPSGIAVNAVAPGAIDTQMMADFNAEDLEFIKEDIPMGRLGKPEEVADLVGFLVSPQADYISGQVLSINGAWHC